MSITLTPPQTVFPLDAVEELQPAVTRFATLPDATSVKDNQLFGIPLKSSLTGQTLPDSAITSAINAAISELEHTLDISITPVEYVERHDYIGDIFQWSYNYTKLHHSPIQTVKKVEIVFANDTPAQRPLIDFPLEFVYVQGQEGTIQLIPALGTNTPGYFLTAFSGTQYAALMAALSAGSFPGGVRVRYIAGFEKDKVPAGMSKLIEIMAAIQILSLLGPVAFPYNSIGVSIDGVSQSTGSAGVRHFVERIESLEKERDRMLDAMKSYYQKRLLLEHI